MAADLFGGSNYDDFWNDNTPRPQEYWSPFEKALGQQWTSTSKPEDASPEAIKVYESSGAVYPYQAPAAPTPTPTPTPTPKPPEEKKGGGGGGGTKGPVYNPPPLQPSPFIMPNGQVPPGMPYSPNPWAVGLQNQALQTALTTPAVTPYTFSPEEMAIRKQQEALLQRLMSSPGFTPPVDPHREAQDRLLQTILNNPIFGPDYVNMLNEQQKELALARGQAAQRQALQSAASRGVAAGGTIGGVQRRQADELTRNLLQSQRDVSLRATEANRQGQQEALGISQQIARDREEQARAAAALNAQVQQAAMQLSESLLGGREDRAFREQATNRASLLDALMASENVFGGREDRGLNVARLMENIRQFDQGLLNRQSEFGAQMGFNYDSLNNSNEQAWINYILSLAGR